MRTVHTIFTFAVFITGTVFADPLFENLSTRAYSMGGASRFLSDDASALFHNPAGMRLSSNRLAHLSAWRIIDPGATPLGAGSLGCLVPLKSRLSLGAGIGFLNFDGNRQQQFIPSAALSFGKLSWGVSCRIDFWNINISASDVSDGEQISSSTAFLNTGVAYRIDENSLFGFMIRNLNGFFTSLDKPSSSELSSLRYPELTAGMKSALARIALYLQAEYIFVANLTQYSVGAETWLNGVFAVRTGLNIRNTIDVLALHNGFSWRRLIDSKLALQFDYAYSVNLFNPDFRGFDTHLFSVSTEF